MSQIICKLLFRGVIHHDYIGLIIQLYSNNEIYDWLGVMSIEMVDLSNLCVVQTSTFKKFQVDLNTDDFHFYYLKCSPESYENLKRNYIVVDPYD